LAWRYNCKGQSQGCLLARLPTIGVKTVLIVYLWDLALGIQLLRPKPRARLPAIGVKTASIVYLWNSALFVIVYVWDVALEPQLLRPKPRVPACKASYYWGPDSFNCLPMGFSPGATTVEAKAKGACLQGFLLLLTQKFKFQVAYQQVPALLPLAAAASS